jgi:transposase InsO family protein
LVVLAHHRRRVLHFNVTEHPTALWTGQQIIEAFPEDTALRYLLRDRDKIYGEEFRQRIRSLRVEEVLSAPASPWHRAYVERLIGSIRRDCLDCVIILGERHLRTILKSYLDYYQLTAQPHKQHPAPPLGHKHDMVFAVPFRMG